MTEFILENVDTGEMMAWPTQGLRWPRTQEFGEAARFGSVDEAVEWRKLNTYNPADWMIVGVGE